jgi:hypothetical protein
MSTSEASWRQRRYRIELVAHETFVPVELHHPAAAGGPSKEQ